MNNTDQVLSEKKKHHQVQQDDTTSVLYTSVADEADRIDVLHVDDNESLLELSKTFLEEENYLLSARTEVSGEDALGYLQANAVDCIVFDYDTPGLNGVELLEQVRETHPDVPFIYILAKDPTKSLRQRQPRSSGVKQDKHMLLSRLRKPRQSKYKRTKPRHTSTSRREDGRDRRDAIEMFDEVAIAVQEAESSTREISEATDDQAASSEEVVSIVDELSSVSQQTAAEASNVSAATEEQTAFLSEVSKNVQGLSQLPETLHDQVSMFSIRSDGAVERGSAADTARRSAVLTDGRGSSTPEDGSDSSLGGI